jgi:hypothetical protein
LIAAITGFRQSQMARVVESPLRRRSTARSSPPSFETWNAAPPPEMSAPAQKARPAPGDDHRAHLVVGVDAAEEVEQVALHRRIVGVELVRPVERHG